MTQPASTPADPPPPPDVPRPEGLAMPKLSAPPASAADWTITWLIGLSGLIPFAVCLVGILMAGPDWDDRFMQAMIAYGALVAAFSSGVRWGGEVVRVQGSGQPPSNPRLIRSAPALVAGLAALLLAPVAWLPALALVIMTGVALLAWDLLAARTGFLPPWMGFFRAVAATLAIAIMIAAAASYAGGRSPLPVASEPAITTAPAAAPAPPAP